MKKLYGRAVALALVSVSALAVPTPAFAEWEQLRACFRGCHEAYQVQTQQPAFYDMCMDNCVAWYGVELIPDPATTPFLGKRDD
jgi:hypothetical protein